MKHSDRIPPSPLGVAAAYAAAAGLWILLSDRFLASLIISPLLLTRLQTYKGWFFVIVTSGLLYWLFRRYRERLIRSERRRMQDLRLFMEHAPAAIAMFDKDMRYIAASLRFKTDYGLGDRDLIGRSHYEVFPEIPERWKEIHRRCLAGAVERCDEDRFIREDGKTDWVRWEIRPWYERDGEIGGVILFSEVITERKQVEAELERYRLHLEELVRERTQELEAANARLKELDRLKSLFIASMSHELRTPLNSIIGYSSILLHGWSGPLSEEQKEKLGAVLRSAKHLLSLINYVIDVSKIEAGGIDAATEDFDLYDLISEAVHCFEAEAREKGLELTAHAVHLRMHTDRSRLFQCILNLLGNAVKFTERGSVTVSIEYPQDPRFVSIFVSDTGMGIRQEDMGRLFQSFSRLDAAHRPNTPGTGLGLYLTKRLVAEVLKGSIDVKSEPGKGSSFGIIIPISI